MYRCFNVIMATAVLVVPGWGVPAKADTTLLPEGFEGRYIAAISDGDICAYAYIDGELGVPRGPDQLTVVPLGGAGSDPQAIEVSNSVINPVYSIAASPDGATIFVAETRLPQDDDDTMLWDLGAGTTLRAIYFGAEGALAVIDEVEVGTEPQGVLVSPDGRTLMLATKTPQMPLSFVTLENGTFGDLRQFELEGVTPMPELLDQGLLPHHAEWYPTEDLVAVTFNFRGQVRFYDVTRDDAGDVSGIRQWGNAVQTSKWPMSGKFSANGQFFVTNDLQWGADVQGFYLNAPPSQLTSIASKADKRALQEPALRRIFGLMQQEAFRQGSRGGAHEARLCYTPWDFDVADVQVPNHMWLGAEDAFVSNEMGRHLERSIPGVGFHLIPGKGHFNIENWDDIFAACVVHLDRDDP